MSPFDDYQLWRGILESLPTGVCVLDLEKRIVLWSDGAERITGRHRHEVVGHSCVGETMLHCDHPDCEWCHEDCVHGRAMKMSQPVEALGFVHHRAGHEVPVRSWAVPVLSGHSSVVGAVEIFEDLHASLPERRHEKTHPGCIDEVTGLPSPVMMRAHLREALATFTEMQVPFAVLCFRVEGLDRFRSAFGPNAAASLLRVIARTLESALWKKDSAGRWSENEFLAILNTCRGEAVSPLRERFRRILAGNAIEWWGERRSLPVVIGQALAQPGDTLEAILARAQKSAEQSCWTSRNFSRSDFSGS
jgi:diguanylate cyclase (GGDEF)-like protein/PAS domain S-box-containing protein